MSRKKTGCRNCMFAPHVTTEGKVTFGAPQKIEDLEALKYSYNYAEGSNYADNIQNIYKKRKTGVDLDLDFSSVSLKIKSQLQGKKYANGGLATGTSDQSIPVAILFQETYDDGSFENVVFYNVKLYEKDGEAKTEGEKIDFTAQGFTGKGLSFENDNIHGDFEYRMDSADPNVDKTKLTDFFNSVKYYQDTISVVYSAYTTGEVTEISLNGVTFNTTDKTFLNVPAGTTTFTFKVGTTTITATLSGATWNFA